jgi:hypothetical protein
MLNHLLHRFQNQTYHIKIHLSLFSMIFHFIVVIIIFSQTIKNNKQKTDRYY